jgi:ligand-binding sensor domain-containing protein
VNLLQFRNGRFQVNKAEPFSHGVVALLADHSGKLWVATAHGELCRYSGGKCTMYSVRDGLANGDIKGLYEDKQGNIWIATLGGISRFDNGHFATWTAKDGLASNLALGFFEDPQGGMWIATQGGGLCRFKNGQFATVTTRNGLYDNLAFYMIADHLGNLWMGSNRGIYRASLKELNDCADGRRHWVTSISYGVADGMLTRECNGGTACRTRDGKLWFPTSKGVVAVNPVISSGERPRVILEKVAIDGRLSPPRRLCLCNRDRSIWILRTLESAGIALKRSYSNSSLPVSIEIGLTAVKAARLIIHGCRQAHTPSA